MPSGRDRRRFQRVNVKLAANVRIDQGPETSAYVLNISQGGALVRCSIPIAAVGQILYLTIPLKNSMLELKAKVSDRGAVELDLSEDEPEKSVIRWVDGGQDGGEGSLGVQFVDLKPEKEAFLGKLVQYLAEKYGWDE